ncbi:hypothetical protein KC19_1G321900 [Ceratodon purpureus]|uniref:Uncharacterized protein n=1 Tax=Ceratodon purpureus TaxID=3225 RepID=A0A8T0JE19_CERPU|nr:hypothetical protein KC19_1G321900 [Ceratodon purpureus]
MQILDKREPSVCHCRLPSLYFSCPTTSASFKIAHVLVRNATIQHMLQRPQLTPRKALIAHVSSLSIQLKHISHRHTFQMRHTSNL